MRILGLVVFLVSTLWMTIAIAEDAPKLREEISVPVEYQGRQIQLTGWFEKPAPTGAVPVVIVLHSCSGYYANMAGGSLPGWVFFLQQQGYATFKLDSFTARGQSEVCASNAVTAGDRAGDVLVAAALPAARPDVKPDRIAAIGRRRGARGQTMRTAPYPRYPQMARVVFFRSGRAARSEPRRPRAPAPHDRRQDGGP